MYIIANKNTCELGKNVNTMSKIFTFFGLFMFGQNSLEKCEENNPS